MTSWGLRYFPGSGDRTAVTVIAGPSWSERREVGRLVLDAGEIEDLRRRLAEREQVTTSDVSVMATEYTVCALPEDYIYAHSFAITVAYRGRGLWAVSRHRMCLGTDGKWDWESIPSERTDEWLATHRFDLDTALALAKQEAPKITVNGFSVADVLSRTEGKR